FLSGSLARLVCHYAVVKVPREIKNQRLRQPLLCVLTRALSLFSQPSGQVRLILAGAEACDKGQIRQKPKI
ncbi:MAG: hypothetical protein LC121_21360, partial [Anaerolineae bacterium]|nr:hypothetical protein [Anaerolineae bacterium]